MVRSEVFARWARLTGRLLAVIGEEAPSDWRRCGAGIASQQTSRPLKGFVEFCATPRFGVRPRMSWPRWPATAS